jgi:hypothetical protein
MVSWLAIIVIVFAVSFSLAVAAAFLATRRSKPPDEMGELRDEVALLRDEVARLRRVVEQDKGPHDSASEAIRPL